VEEKVDNFLKHNSEAPEGFSVSRGSYGSFLEKGGCLLQWLLLCKSFFSGQIISIPERNLGFWETAHLHLPYANINTNFSQ